MKPMMSAMPMLNITTVHSAPSLIRVVSIWVVGEYRMSYLILDDEIIVTSFVHGRSDVAHD